MDTYRAIDAATAQYKTGSKKKVKHAGTTYRPYQDALNAFLSLGAFAMLVYGVVALRRNSQHALWRWFAIDLMVQVISIKIATDLITHGIEVPGQNQMDAAVGVMLMALLVVVLIGDMTGLSATSQSQLWYLVDGAEMGLFVCVVLKYLTELVA